MKNEKLNSMCLDCQHLNKACSGDHSSIYSGCIWKNADEESLKRFQQRIDGTLTEEGAKE